MYDIEKYQICKDIVCECMQSMPITTKAVRLNTAHGEVYSI